MNTSQAEMEAAVQKMKAHHWIDMHTRAVFVEFSLFNPGHNLYMTALLLVQAACKLERGMDKSVVLVPSHRCGCGCRSSLTPLELCCPRTSLTP